MAVQKISKPHFKDNIQNLQGRDYIKYEGLLAEWHLKNDAWVEKHPEDEDQRSIGVKTIQLPSADNGNSAVCQATVTMAWGTSYIDIGDADDKNTNRMVAPAKIRMASTRAKGRALRDALNIGETMYEEMPEADLPGNDTPKPKGDAPATDEQLAEIKQLSDALGKTTAIPKSLTQETAQSLIDQLEAELSEQTETLKRLKKTLTPLVGKYAEQADIAQDDAVAEIKAAAGIPEDKKLGQGTVEQLEAALEFLKEKGVK